ncbi:hypothetical protein D3C81_2167300 [compost metagenome]
MIEQGIAAERRVFFFKEKLYQRKFGRRQLDGFPAAFELLGDQVQRKRSRMERHLRRLLTVYIDAPQ